MPSSSGRNSNNKKGEGGGCSRSNFDRIIDKHEDVVVEFVQSECEPCAAYKKKAGVLAPVMKGAKKVRVVLGPEACEDLADRYHIRETPSLVVLKNGKPVGKPIVADDTADGLKQTKSELADRLGK